MFLSLPFLRRARPGAALALLAALCLALPAQAQTWIRSEPDPSVSGLTLARSPAGLVAVLEQTGGLNRVMLLDAHGAHLRTLQLFTSGDVPPAPEIAHFDGEDALLLAGSYDERPWVARVAVSDGTVEWARTLTTKQKGALHAVEINDAGHLVVAGWTFTSGLVDGTLLAAVAPATGNVHYRRYWPKNRVTTLTTLANGDMLIAQHGTLTRTTAWGHPLWSKRLDVGGNLYQSRVVETPDGDLLALGVQTLDNFEYRIAAWRLAPDGTPRWARSIDTYQSALIFESVDVTAAAPTSDGGLVASITVPSPADDLRGAAVLRIDGDGDLLWLRLLNTLNEPDTAVDLARTPGDGVVVLIDDVDAGLRVARLDAQGQSASCPVGGLGILGQEPLTLTATDTPFNVSNVDELWEHVAHIPLVSARALVEVCSDSCSVIGASFGVGTAGSGGWTPRLHANDGACVGDTPTLDISGALGAAHGLVFLGFGPAELPGLGGTFLVDPSPMKIFNLQLSGAAGVPGAGNATLPTGGDLTSVQGITVYLQAVFADPAGPTGKTLSNGVSVTIE